MKSNRQFVIPFKGLKSGRHDFVFEIDDRFFDGFEASEIKKGKVHIEVCMNKKVNLLEFDFHLSGNVAVTCDRCLDEFELPVDYEARLFVKFGDHSEEQTDEMITLAYEEHEIDVSQYIYEYVHLSLPYRRVHPDNEKGESGCNREMIKKLEQYSVHGDESNRDPRWDDLKNIFLNNN